MKSKMIFYVGNGEEEICKMISYVGNGEEEICNRPAVAWLHRAVPVCAECIKNYHPRHITPLSQDEICDSDNLAE